MGLGHRFEKMIEKYRERKLKRAPGPYGDFYRVGGDELIYDLPVKTGDLVIDAGGYEGEWTSQMIARYGCRSEVFEPFQVYADRLQTLFAKNSMVHVHAAALGGSMRTAKFSFAADGTSEFRGEHQTDAATEAPVVDVAHFFNQLSGEQVACLKLNIEGGEYEVLERLLDTDSARRCNSILVQFHTQPDGYEQRLKDIEARLQQTHWRAWSYHMVWEKWILRGLS